MVWGRDGALRHCPVPFLFCKNVISTRKSDRINDGNEEAVYECIKLNNDITTKAISDDLGISLRTVQRCLTALKENGLIICEGSKTNGRWVILK